MNGSHLQIEERQERRWLRLTLIGELDLAPAPVLEARLEELKDHGAARLDLSRPDFMDSSGCIF
jgi:anti-anti-sigma factor